MQSQKPLVAVPAQLAGRRQALQRLVLEHGAGADLIERPRLAEEEAAVDPLLHSRLLDEAR